MTTTPVAVADPAGVRPRGGRAVTGLFAATMLLGAALSFAVQPMFARIVLPVLGGSAAVWSTSMVFFQAALLVGYGYGHLAVRRLGSRRQAVLHLLLLLPPMLLLPAAIPAGWQPPVAGSPMLWLLGVLAVTVGPPFVAVAATTPLLSRWYVDSGHPRGGDPYFLYGASNLGSILGLLSYPLLIEPVLPLPAQGRLWKWGYLLFVLLVVGCALVLWRSPGAPVASTVDTPASPRPARVVRLRWLGLAFVPACLLVGMTSVLTTDLAPIPLLWVLPLVVYLATFVLAFSPRPAAARALLVARRLLPALAGIALWLLLSDANGVIVLYLVFHLVVFGAAALCCHGRLALERPPADRLTGFYLTLAAGGALGGVAAALVAPLIFNHFLEYPLGLVLAVLALPVAARRGRGPWSGLAIVAGLPALTALGLVVLRHWHAGHRAELALLGAAVVAVLALRGRRYVRAVALAAVFLVAASTLDQLDGVITADRGFYGALAVRDVQGYHILLDGSTIHGAQATDPARRTTPLTYFTVTGPLGTVVRTARQRGLTGQAAVIGLGAGTTACQFEAGEQVTFFELDPLVARVAAEPGLFSYLRDCPARSRLVLGDGRLSLSREQSGRYGLVVLDAFASDVVPVHLLTRQAVELYRSRLVPGGLIAFNVSNRYVALEPVLGRVAADLGMTCMATLDTDVSVEAGKTSSRWVVMAALPADLGGIRSDPHWSPCRASGRVWTDDYANVLGALDW